MKTRKGRRRDAWKYAECYFSFVEIGFNCLILSYGYMYIPVSMVTPQKVPTNLSKSAQNS